MVAGAAVPGMAGVPVLICLLGNFRVLKAGLPVPVRPGGKVEALLCVLSLAHDRGVPRDALLSALWPNGDGTLAGQSLNSLVYSVHRLLGEAIGGAPPVVRRDGSYCLNFEAGIMVDFLCFDRLVAVSDECLRAGLVERAMAGYAEAVALYQGGLWSGADLHTDTLALMERERLRAQYLSLLARLAQDAFDHGRYDECLECASRILAEDPCREDAHRLAMRCYVRRGERAQALRQYRLCQAVLRREFEMSPEPATQLLFEQIRLSPEST